MAVDPTYGGVRQPILAVFFFFFFRIRLKTAASLVFMWRSVGFAWRDGEPRANASVNTMDRGLWHRWRGKASGPIPAICSMVFFLSFFFLIVVVPPNHSGSKLSTSRTRIRRAMMMNRTRMGTSLSWTGSGGSHVGLLGDVGGESASGMKFPPCSFDTAVSAIIASSDGDMDYVNTPVAAERVYIKTRSDVEELIETRIQAVRFFFFLLVLLGDAHSLSFCSFHLNRVVRWRRLWRCPRGCARCCCRGAGGTRSTQSS